MEIHNRDVFPPQEVRDVYALVQPLILNKLVDDRFRLCEKAATTAKTKYHGRGRIAMLLVATSAIFTVAEALVIPRIPHLATLSAIFVVFGAVGFLIQVHLVVTRQKETWLLNRFAAERLRSIKFQAYPLAWAATSQDDLAQKVNHFCTEEIARLDMELNARTAALVLFSPAKAVGCPTSAPVSIDSRLATIVSKAYRELRIAYQHRFAADEIETLQQKQRIGYTSADMLYLLGAFLTIAALCCKVLDLSASNWIDFVAVVAFIVGLTKTIMDNAALTETSKSRYEDYLRSLDDCEEELAAEGAGFPEVVRRTERVVLEELSHFCQSASQISYRL